MVASVVFFGRGARGPAYCVRYSVSEPDKLHLPFLMLPMRVQGENQLQGRCLRLCIVVKQSYMLKALKSISIGAVRGHARRETIEVPNVIK